MTKSFLNGRHSSKWMIDEKTDIEQKQNVKNIKKNCTENIHLKN